MIDDSTIGHNGGPALEVIYTLVKKVLLALAIAEREDFSGSEKSAAMTMTLKADRTGSITATTDQIKRWGSIGCRSRVFDVTKKLTSKEVGLFHKTASPGKTTIYNLPSSEELEQAWDAHFRAASHPLIRTPSVLKNVNGLSTPTRTDLSTPTRTDLSTPSRTKTSKNPTKSTFSIKKQPEPCPSPTRARDSSACAPILNLPSEDTLALLGKVKGSEDSIVSQFSSKTKKLTCGTENFSDFFEFAGKPLPGAAQSPAIPKRKRKPVFEAWEIYREPFERFWEAFPGAPPPRGRKTDKAKAFETFVQIVTNTHTRGLKASTDTMIGAADVYASKHPELKFIPMPTTWLNGGRWEDHAPKPKPIIPPEDEELTWEQKREIMGIGMPCQGRKFERRDA